MSGEGIKKSLRLAMLEMQNPIKDKTANGGRFSYKYETLEQVLSVVKPALFNQNLTLMQGIKWSDKCNGFVLETGIMSSDEEMILDYRPFPQCSDAQSHGSWETYLRRYALRTAFGLTGEDDDGARTLQFQMANGSDYELLNTQIDTLSMMIDKSHEEVVEMVMKSKTMSSKGAKWEQLSKSQADAAKELLAQWIKKAEPENEIADQDIPF